MIEVAHGASRPGVSIKKYNIALAVIPLLARLTGKGFCQCSTEAKVCIH